NVLQLERNHLFFFQAEDGIRDDLVTGVQTCALPIWQSGESCRRRARSGRNPDLDGYEPAESTQGRLRRHELPRGLAGQPGRKLRSEERRVGKECRNRGWVLVDRKESGAHYEMEESTL